MREIDKLTGGEPIIGHRKDGDPADEREHFYVCAHCGQPVDKRDLGAVMHHGQAEHYPLPEEDAERVTRAGDMLRKTLEEEPACPVCKGSRWVCENHPRLSWPDECDCGAGAPCPVCNIAEPPAMPPDFEPDQE